MMMNGGRPAEDVCLFFFLLLFLEGVILLSAVALLFYMFRATRRHWSLGMRMLTYPAAGIHTYTQHLIQCELLFYWDGISTKCKSPRQKADQPCRGRSLRHAARQIEKEKKIEERGKRQEKATNEALSTYCRFV